MKKIFLKNFSIFCFLLICTSLSYATNISYSNNQDIVINSKKVNMTIPSINYKGYILVPVKNILPYFTQSTESISYTNNSIYLKRYSSILTLTPNDINAYIDGNKIQLPTAPIIYKSTIYAPLRVISDFFDCYTYYDENNRTIFIKDLNEYQQLESFFKKVNNKLLNVNSLQIDIINEMKNNSSSYTFGDSIYIDKTGQKIYQKNVLDTNWKESDVALLNSHNFSNDIFNIGLSFDRSKSDENQMIFNGYFPTKYNTLCKSTIYIDTNNLYITKQIAEFVVDNVDIRQTILYTYN